MGQGKIVYILPYGDVYDPSRPKGVKKLFLQSTLLLPWNVYDNRC